MAIAPNDYRYTENTSIRSHNGPIRALSFTPDGHSMVSIGGDGTMHLWDLVQGGKGGGGEGGEGEGSGGPQLIPLRFMGPQFQPLQSMINKNRTATTTTTTKMSYPLWVENHHNVVSSSSSSSLPNCWIGIGTNLYGYSLRTGGCPKQILQGHLHTITCIQSNPDGTRHLLSAGFDGMILTWGRKQFTKRSKRSRQQQRQRQQPKHKKQKQPTFHNNDDDQDNKNDDYYYSSSQEEDSDSNDDDDDDDDDDNDDDDDGDHDHDHDSW